MPLSVQINQITRNQSGLLTLEFTGNLSGSGQNISWADLTAVQSAVLPPSVVNVNNELGVLLMLVAWWLARDPSLTTDSIVLGKTATVDFTNSAVFTVTG